jgi:hypothetical protein
MTKNTKYPQARERLVLKRFLALPLINARRQVAAMSEVERRKLPRWIQEVDKEPIAEFRTIQGGEKAKLRTIARAWRMALALTLPGLPSSQIDDILAALDNLLEIENSRSSGLARLLKSHPEIINQLLSSTDLSLHLDCLTGAPSNGSKRSHNQIVLARLQKNLRSVGRRSRISSIAGELLLSELAAELPNFDALPIQNKSRLLESTCSPAIEGYNDNRKRGSSELIMPNFRELVKKFSINAKEGKALSHIEPSSSNTSADVTLCEREGVSTVRLHIRCPTDKVEQLLASLPGVSTALKEHREAGSGTPTRVRSIRPARPGLTVSLAAGVPSSSRRKR